MKNLKLIALLMAAVVLSFTACDKDDDDEPQGTAVEVNSYELSDDNTTLTINFNQGVYANADQSGNLDASSFELTFVGDNPISASFTAQHVAGDTEVLIEITYGDRPDGEGTLQVTVKANTVYGTEGNALGQDITEDLDVNELGIIGKWSAYDVSAILVSVGFDDSLYAVFRQDQSYLVTAYMGGIPVTFEGVYTMEASGIGNIWNITLNQTAMGGQPTELTSEGIFEIYAASPDSMWYEVAQVDPAIAGVTPPTADAGFGSTSGGALGTANVQKYLWIGME